MGDNLEHILRENDLRLRREARNDPSLRGMMDGWALLEAGIQPETPSPTGVDEFPFNARGNIYKSRRRGKSRRRRGKSRRGKSRRGKSRRRKSSK
tara:strand:- start:3764 stop:4048 length:285 start_codon:yes stop_codon:yes gene_type:complete